jgi:protocatechuate 3,4-dioxygenase beta subunit
MKLAFVLAGILFAPAIVAQPTPAPSPNTPSTTPSPTTDPKDLASIAGRTLNAAGQPIRKTSLTLRPANAQPGQTPVQSYTATSDAEGKFSFEGIEPGRYQLWAEHAGYLRQAYGNKRSNFQGAMLTLTAGQHLTGLNFELTRQATIYGKVLDEDGDPVVRVQVRLMRRGYRDGKRNFIWVGQQMTDNDGEFKFKAIGPGRYYLSAKRANMAAFNEITRPAAGQAGKPEEDFVLTYYPSVTDVSAAAPIDVIAGRDVPGIDIELRKAQVFRVRGKVSGALSSSPQRMQVTLLSREEDMLGVFVSGVPIGKDGSFEFAGVQPGPYTLVAASPEGVYRVIARQPLDVGNGNVENVALEVQPLLELQGSVKVEGPQNQDPTQKPAQTPNFQVFLMPSELFPMAQPHATVGADGSFTLSNLTPAKYTVQATGNPDGTFLKSVRFGGTDVLTESLDLSHGAAGTLTIVFQAGAAELTGIAQNDQGQPAPGSIGTLVPDPLQPQQRSLYHSMTADQNGRFTLKNLAPGKYRLYSWDDIEAGAWMDPEFMKPHESKGTPVTLAENDHQQVNVMTITAAETEQAKQGAK